MSVIDTTEFAVPVAKMLRDLKLAAATMGDDQARHMVDSYYAMQEYRKASDNQERSLGDSVEPHVCISWVSEQFSAIENSVKNMLGEYAKSKPIGRWSMSVFGIGPVISAGLLAHIDMERAAGAGNIWRYAGLDPSIRWVGKVEAEQAYKEAKANKLDAEGIIAALCGRFGRDYATSLRFASTDKDGKPCKITERSTVSAFVKRPWNARLKTICWKIGDSFVKFSNNPKCFYGKCYKIRKAYEIGRNESGKLAANAAAKLERFNIRDKETREKYESGHLPDGHIDMMARRWTVKLFLSHWHEMAYRFAHGGQMPKIYTFEVQGHRDYIPPVGIEDHFPDYESGLPPGVRVAREYKI